MYGADLLLRITLATRNRVLLRSPSHRVLGHNRRCKDVDRISWLHATSSMRRRVELHLTGRAVRRPACGSAQSVGALEK